MQPIISIVGKSESGKTTLLEALIPELQRRGHRVAVIKHTGGDHDFDTPEKDTWRFRRAGSVVSAITAAHQAAVFIKTDAYKPADFALFAGDCDLILTEGFKQSNYPRIEVHRKEQGSGLLSPAEQLIAVVTNEPFNVAVPQFTTNDAQAIADLIESKFMTKSAGVDIDLFCNGAFVPTTDFCHGLLARTLGAMIPGIGESGEIQTLHISLRRKR